MLFYIEVIAGDVKVPLTDAEGRMEWDKGDEAQAEAKRLNEFAKTTGDLKRFRVKRDLEEAKKNVDMNWAKKAQKRFADGEWKPVPWSNEPWWNDPHGRYSHRGGMLQNAAKWHYVHMSKQHPGYVAYFPSEERGMQWRLEYMTAGRYLHKLFDQTNNRYFDKLQTEQMVQHWACRAIAASGNFKLSFAKTADEMIQVYRNGPESCMSYELSDKWKMLPAHPVSAYAAGDLEIAYLHGVGGVAARCICWPARKRFGRVYLSESEPAGLELRTRLEAQGWLCIRNNEHGFAGARLQAIELNKDQLDQWKAAFGHRSPTIGYVCPHLDHENFVVPRDGFLWIDKGTGLFARDMGHGVAHGYRCATVGCNNFGSKSRGHDAGKSFYCKPCETNLLQCHQCYNHVQANKAIVWNADSNICFDCASEYLDLCGCCEEQPVWHPINQRKVMRFCDRCYDQNRIKTCNSCGTRHPRDKDCHHCEKRRKNTVKVADTEAIISNFIAQLGEPPVEELHNPFQGVR